jgi:hypothetical protein
MTRTNINGPQTIDCIHIKLGGNVEHVGVIKPNGECTQPTVGVGVKIPFCKARADTTGRMCPVACMGNLLGEKAGAIDSRRAEYPNLVSALGVSTESGFNYVSMPEEHGQLSLTQVLVALPSTPNQKS